MDQVIINKVNRWLYFAALETRQLESVLQQGSRDVESRDVEHSGKVACAREAACLFLEQAVTGLLAAIDGELSSDRRLAARLAALDRDDTAYGEQNAWIALLDNRDSWLRSFLRALQSLDKTPPSPGSVLAGSGGAPRLIIATEAGLPSPDELLCWAGECRRMMDRLRESQEEY